MYILRARKFSGDTVVHTTELDWAFEYIEAWLTDPLVKRITLLRNDQ